MAASTGKRAGLLAGAILIGVGLSFGTAFSEPEPRPAPPQPSGGTTVKKPSTKPAKPRRTKKQRQTEQRFYDGYTLAYNLVEAGKFAEAFTAFRALDQDDHPDVANYLGFTSRKLGRYEDAKYWYERALAADPKHVRTWQYYGMWHVEQGNMLKAQDYLETIRGLCGGVGCKEYAHLRGAMEGTVVY